MKMEIKPDGSTELSFPTEDDIILLSRIWKSLFGEKNPFINYDTDWNRSYYNDESINWLKTDDDKISAPFEVLYDYDKCPVRDWGSYRYKGEFSLTPSLALVKKEMLDIFSKSDKIYKNNSNCPRVSDVVITRNGPLIDIQKATYYDQVATNLSLDYKHKTEIKEILGTEKVRDWDVLQSGVKKGKLPPFSLSRLANTIGVAAGIITVNKTGKEVVILRKRTKSVAVNANALALPLSFALHFDISATETPSGSILDLIKSDFKHEQAEELGIDVSEIDFSNIKPLLLCRELCRGGKPQFILEMKTKYTYEELLNKIKESPINRREFETQILGLTIEDICNSKQKFSSDVLAFIVAKARRAHRGG